MSEQKLSVRRLLPYLLVGFYFGIVFSKSEVISWFRIQEMFRFQAFHMYSIIGSAVVVSMVSVQFIRKKGVKTFGGEDIVIPPKQMGSGTRYWLGGTIFGLGWALTGSCPGPMYALIGNGYLIMLLALASAFAGTYVYGMLRPRLPH